MFITALFRIAKVWNQPRCPSTDKENVGYMNNRYYSAIMKIEIVSFAGK
jgi:hypothetical protein